MSARERDEIGRLGNYRVFRLIGVGGMGFVFEAEEIDLRRRVALKVLRPELCAEEENRRRFVREAQAIAAIDSDHVVAIHRIVDGDPPYLAMQLLTGESLQSLIERPDSITLSSALEIARQTAEGLVACHALGIIHRDIKPANLWLELKDGKNPGSRGKTSSSSVLGSSFRVKILDFGLARRSAVEVSLTSTGFIVGTPNYMSPEQASGVDVDVRADLFSLGSVLYTMLTGELPFPGTSAMAVMMSLANHTPPPPHTKNSGVPEIVSNYTAKLMQKNRDLRPDSAHTAVLELEELIAQLKGSSSLLVRLPKSMSTSAIATTGEIQTLLADRAELRLREADSLVPKTAPQLASRRRWIDLAMMFAGALAVAVLLYFVAFWKPKPASDGVAGSPPTESFDPIPIGVLHSQTGKMAAIEKPVIDSTLLALEELNRAGGVLGRQLKPILADGKSDPDEFARAAEKLFAEDKVAVVFGCWTSTQRRTVRPVLERNNGLLFFPAQTEGMEQSPRIVYLGPAPNQHIIPAIDFLTESLQKKRIFVVGSDSVFPRLVTQVVKDHLEEKGHPEYFLGEAYLNFASTETLPIVERIQRERPDAIVNLLYGTANIELFEDLRRLGITPDRTVTLSVAITQNEVKAMNPAKLAGDYLAASYFQAVERPQGKAFAEAIKRKYGRNAIATDAMGAAYGSVNLWAKTAKAIGSVDPSAVVGAVRGQDFEGPRGLVKIDRDNLYTWLPARVAKIRADGELELVDFRGLNVRIAPIPYPSTRSPERWEELLAGLNFKWHGKWLAPPPSAVPK